MRQPLNYIQQFGHFQRNARLYLISNVLSGVTTGILLVLYNLYLFSLGYGADFIGLVLFVGTIGAGIAIFPAGICIDRFGGKAVVIWSNLLIGFAGIGQILFRQPVPLLVSAFIAGIGGAGTLVVNAPFLTINSAPGERSHLDTESRHLAHPERATAVGDGLSERLCARLRRERRAAAQAEANRGHQTCRSIDWWVWLDSDGPRRMLCLHRGFGRGDQYAEPQIGRGPACAQEHKGVARDRLAQWPAGGDEHAYRAWVRDARA